MIINNINRLSSYENFYFGHDEIKKYFNKSKLTPYVFGIQLNLARSDLRVFLKGRISLESEIPDTIIPDKSSSTLLFYMAGGGMEHKFPITDIIIPGIKVGIYYLEIANSLVKNNEIAERNFFRGISGEFNGNCTLKLWNLGLYGEVAYHIIPVLKSTTKSWQTGAMSIGVGLTYFLK